MTTYRALNLGELIDVLESFPAFDLVRLDTEEGVGILTSYRGYYEDLAMTPASTPGTVAALLGSLRGAVGQSFTGFKGGDYPMVRETRVWVSAYGTASGIRPVGVRVRAWAGRDGVEIVTCDMGDAG